MACRKNNNKRPKGRGRGANLAVSEVQLFAPVIGAPLSAHLIRFPEGLGFEKREKRKEKDQKGKKREREEKALKRRFKRRIGTSKAPISCFHKQVRTESTLPSSSTSLLQPETGQRRREGRRKKEGKVRPSSSPSNRPLLPLLKCQLAA